MLEILVIDAEILNDCARGETPSLCLVQGQRPERGSGPSVRPAQGRLPARVQQTGCHRRLLAVQGGGSVCNEVIIHYIRRHPVSAHCLRLSVKDVPVTSPLLAPCILKYQLASAQFIVSEQHNHILSTPNFGSEEVAHDAVRQRRRSGAELCRAKRRAVALRSKMWLRRVLSFCPSSKVSACQGRLSTRTCRKPWQCAWGITLLGLAGTQQPGASCNTAYACH